MSDATGSAQPRGTGSAMGQQPTWSQQGVDGQAGVDPDQGPTSPGAPVVSPAVAAPVARQKKGLGCWAIGAIVVGALVVLGALATLVFALLVANEVENMDTGQGLAPTGGTYATEELESIDFAFSDPETVFDDSDLLVEVAGGQLLVTSRNAAQMNIATWETTPTTSLLIAADMTLPGASSADQTVLGGVAVGLADDVDYVLMCGSDGIARLERAEPSTSATGSAILQEFPNSGCGGAFTLALEVYSPAGAPTTEIFGTLPNGTPFTFTDTGNHGLVADYGFLADADAAPVTVAVTSFEVYAAP